MLVLTRKLKQSIMIGDDVEIAVLAVAGDKVRLGISAPRSIPVFRKEIYLEMQDGEPIVGRVPPRADVSLPDAPVEPVG